MGALTPTRPGGTVSATGARFIVTPAARSCPPQVVARCWRRDADHWPCVTALGITENPGPPSTWTFPPSWSVETSIFSRTPRTGVASDPARAVTAPTAPVPAVV
jgi:hypothetical protein